MSNHQAARDPYLRIAARNVAMARLLHLKAFYEGSVFHVCHVFECVISAGIASQNQPIPRAYDPTTGMTAHARKIAEFRFYCGPWIAGTPFQRDFDSLAVFLASLSSSHRRAEQVRNDALYWVNGAEPQNRFGRQDSALLTWRVRRFFRQAQAVLPAITVS